MNSKNIIALQGQERNLCMKCLQKKATNIYTISSRGYGSLFDSWNTSFQCCDDCNEDIFNEWFNEIPYDKNCWTEEYKYEDNIVKLIKSLPLQSQELFYNVECNIDYKMDSQDWIDYKLDELPHEKCKEYCLFSPQEKEAYFDRFPTCDKVYLEVFSDDSFACYCDYGSHGESDGTCSNYISDKCYMCTHYNMRESELLICTVNEKEEILKREKSRLTEMLEYASKKLAEL